jgi:hypothetical protein
MGTRSIICVFYRGRFVIAQYSQWDGYPSGQGVTILKFISNPENIQRLKDGLQFIDYVGKEELKAIYDQASAMFMEDQENGIRFLTYVYPMKRNWPSLSRDTGGEILEIIANATAENRVQIDKDLEFVNNGLFCEWVYVVDLDQGVFEVYGGCQPKSEAAKKRFNDVGDENATVPAFIVSFALDSLPSEEGFLTCPEFRATEEDDEEVENAQHGGDDPWEGFDDGDDGEHDEGDAQADDEADEEYYDEGDGDGYEGGYGQRRATPGPFECDEEEYAQDDDEGYQTEQNGGNGQVASARGFFGCVIF